VVVVVVVAVAVMLMLVVTTKVMMDRVLVVHGELGLLETCHKHVSFQTSHIK
jgi:hypothetical protein